MDKNIKKKRRVNKMYLEFKRIKDAGIELQFDYGRYEYVFSSPRGEVRLVQLKNYYPGVPITWEIHYNGIVQKVNDKEQAEKIIEHLLVVQKKLA